MITAAGVPLEDALEAAVLVLLGPGQYTAILVGSNETTGVGLLEIYILPWPLGATAHDDRLIRELPAAIDDSYDARFKWCGSRAFPWK